MYYQFRVSKFPTEEKKFRAELRKVLKRKRQNRKQRWTPGYPAVLFASPRKTTNYSYVVTPPLQWIKTFYTETSAVLATRSFKERDEAEAYVLDSLGRFGIRPDELVRPGFRGCFACEMPRPRL